MKHECEECKGDMQVTYIKHMFKTTTFRSLFLVFIFFPAFIVTFFYLFGFIATLILVIIAYIMFITETDIAIGLKILEIFKIDL